MGVLAIVNRPRAARIPRPKPRKYYGLCMREDGTEITLVARAFSEQEACRQLHRYNIVMVLDLLTSEDIAAQKKSRRGSMTGIPELL